MGRSILLYGDFMLHEIEEASRTPPLATPTPTPTLMPTPTPTPTPTSTSISLSNNDETTPIAFSLDGSNETKLHSYPGNYYQGIYAFFGINARQRSISDLLKQTERQQPGKKNCCSDLKNRCTIS